MIRRPTSPFIAQDKLSSVISTEKTPKTLARKQTTASVGVGGGYLSQYDYMLNNLTKSIDVDTEINVIRIIITYDSARAITICKKSDELFIIKLFSLKDYSKVAQIVIKGEYLKMNEIVQNDSGKLFNVVY